MTTETRVTVAEERAARAERLGGALQARKDTLKQMLGGSDTRVDRFIKVTWYATTKNPDLLDCSLESLVASIMEAADYGLEPTGGFGGAHLIPYKGKATLIVDYRGLVQMALAGGDIVDVETRLVYEGDKLELRLGSDPYVLHVPAPVDGVERGGYKLVYTMLRFRDPSVPAHIDYMTMVEIDAIRDRTPGARKGPWSTDYGEMAKKTALRRALKLRATSPKIAQALEREDELGAGDGVSAPAPAPSERRSRLLAAVGAPALAETPEPVAEPANPGVDAEKAPAAAEVATERDPAVEPTRELFADFEPDPETES